jgi:hypothetical protein
METMTRSPSARFDRFLFAPLDEDGETPLSVLSVLARQDLDAWQEAARLDQLPRDSAVAAFASMIRQANGPRWSHSEASTVAAGLVRLLPSHDASLDGLLALKLARSRFTRWLVCGMMLGSVAMFGNINEQMDKRPPQASRDNRVLQPELALPPPTPGMVDE